MIKIASIKKSLVDKLKKVRDVDVTFETIQKSNSNTSIEKLDSWYYVSLLPLNNSLYGTELRDRNLLVDISYYSKKASVHDYYVWNDDMEANFIPIIPIEDRKITIEQSSFKIIDDVAHFIFSLKFRDAIEITSEEVEVHSLGGESSIDLKII